MMLSFSYIVTNDFDFKIQKNCLCSVESNTDPYYGYHPTIQMPSISCFTSYNGLELPQLSDI